MKTIDWKSIQEPVALQIGHDPCLQKSDTIAEYTLFADYFFRPKPLNQGQQIIIPILHSKNYPLKGNFKSYSLCYQNIIEYFERQLDI